MNIAKEKEIVYKAGFSYLINSAHISWFKYQKSGFFAHISADTVWMAVKYENSLAEENYLWCGLLVPH